MATKPALDQRRLFAALKDQGFTIEQTRLGYRILAPDGAGTAGLHSSIFDGSVRDYRNQIADLSRIGFDLSKIDASDGNGGADQWKAERDQIEAQIAEANSKVEADTEALAAKASADAAYRARVEALSPALREAYDLMIAEHPGGRIPDYAQTLGISTSATSVRFVHLASLGLLVRSGPKHDRHFYTEQNAPEGVEDVGPQSNTPQTRKRDRHAKPHASANGRPSAGTLHTREVEPADPVVRFRKLASRLTRMIEEEEARLVERKALIVTMVDAYTEQEKDRVELRNKAQRLERILGQAVDVI